MLLGKRKEGKVEGRKMGKKLTKNEKQNFCPVPI
jgi:hypothetical protein